jgi:nucleotide-binding universal stress UspA family protein
MLVPTDGSEGSLRAVDFAATLARRISGAEIHLVHVEPPLPQAVADFVDADAIRSFHADRSAEALRPAIARLDAAGIPWHRHACVGEPGPTIAKMAAELGCEQIVMGTRGLGLIAGMLLGSVARRVVHEAAVPVTLVK